MNDLEKDSYLQKPKKYIKLWCSLTINPAFNFLRKIIEERIWLGCISHFWMLCSIIIIIFFFFCWRYLQTIVSIASIGLSPMLEYDVRKNSDTIELKLYIYIYNIDVYLRSNVWSTLFFNLKKMIFKHNFISIDAHIQ